MAGLKKAIVMDRSGDGNFLRKLPALPASVLRSLATKFRGMRQKRAQRTVARIYTVLRALEGKVMDDGELMLAKKPFSKAIRDPKIIERGLKLFRGAWDMGLIDICDGQGKSATILKPKDGEVMVGACGMSVKAVERLYLYRAARLIMKGHPKVQLNQKNMITGPEVLPRLRDISKLDQDVLVTLYKGMGQRFKEIFTVSADTLSALRKFKPYHAEAMQKAMGAKFSDVLQLSPEMLMAIAESLSNPKQIEDLGEYIMLLKGPDEVHAVGAWEVREKDGDTVTDIGAARNMLGAEFQSIVEQNAGLIVSVGDLIKRIRAIDNKRDRISRTEELKTFVKRYLPYMSGDAIDAMKLGGGDDKITISFSEGLSILDGIWNKEGVGKKFFDTLMEHKEGAKLLGATVDAYLDMKKRGSVKEGSDVGAMIRDSDLFDQYLGLG